MTIDNLNIYLSTVRLNGFKFLLCIFVIYVFFIHQNLHAFHFLFIHYCTVAPWLRTAKNWNVRTGSLARSLVCSFARTAHSFACSTMLASLARSVVLICPLARSLTPELALWSITAKNTDRSTGPLARPFARSIAPLTRGKLNR